ncbi:pyridoxal-phosphate-dependent aminotransferase family protein [Streptomyces odontomachi]|uniref:pyridoxal-phosphate-dependent aminotransferase family protein n=1 Tax=Streptomyces odontomachi TaxID=2944940 RepID=UPI00210897AB|nr:aminotransferase class V-fold PLP-dependent enzyme [Streptomyces sp. ODS25]
MTQALIRQPPETRRPARLLEMVVGPTAPPPSVLERIAAPAPPLTDLEFIAEFGRCLVRLRELIGSTSAAVAVVPGSGTNGMESLAVSLLKPEVPVLVASTGMWGDRWRDICLRHHIPVRAPRFAAGRAPDLELVEKLLSREQYQAVLVAHVDSSSGVRTDLAEVTELAHRHGALCLVDGVSAIGAEQIEFDEWGVDAYLGGPPKGLASAPGLAMYALSERAVELLNDRTWQRPTFSLDLGPWLPVMDAMERGVFGYFQSPAGNLVLGLSEALRLALEEGREARVNRHASLRDKLHAGMAEAGLDLLVPEPAERANGVTVGILPEGMTEAEFLSAVTAHGVLLNPGTFSPLGRRTFRIGHLGTVNDEDIARTVAAVQAVMATQGSKA